MVLIESTEQLAAFLEESGNKLLLVFIDHCDHCVSAKETINNCINTTKLLFNSVAFCEEKNTGVFCQENNIENFPTIIIYNGKEEISRIDFAPPQDLFLSWITDITVI